MPTQSEQLTSVEVCAGAGGQALGLERSGFEHIVLIELDTAACETLRENRPAWNILQQDLRDVNGQQFFGADLLAGGVPCPPFSVAGKQLGERDERDLFPEMLRLTKQICPRAVMIENVPGLLSPRFARYRARIEDDFRHLGFEHLGWRLLQASDFGVPQLRSRVVMVALRGKEAGSFDWPQGAPGSAPTVGEVLHAEMASNGWRGADAFRIKANAIAPTLVGGSKRHGGPDLGPTRSKVAWAELGVNAHTIAELPPQADLDGMPRLTVRMAALLQGFPSTWAFTGGKTAAYRQVGNAFPPPVAQAVGERIAAALRSQARRRRPGVAPGVVVRTDR